MKENSQWLHKSRTVKKFKNKIKEEIILTGTKGNVKFYELVTQSYNYQVQT